MRASIGIAVLATTFVITGCTSDLESFAARHVTPAERRFSIEYLQLLQAGEVDSAYAQLVPELQTTEIWTQLEGMPGMLAGTPLDSLVLVGVNVHTGPGEERRVNLSYEVAVEGGYLTTNVATGRVADVTLVEGFSARLAQTSLFTAHRFTFEDRSLVHFIWLGMAIVMPIVCISAAVLVARTVGMPKRWLWAVVALLAAPVFAINWTTGAWELRGLAFLFLGASVLRAGSTAPWIVSFGVPLGAALALWKRAQWRRTTQLASNEPAV